MLVGRYSALFIMAFILGAVQAQASCNSISIDRRLTGGASGYPVYSGKCDGKDVAIKIVNNNELALIKRVQDKNYVVAILDVISTAELKRHDSKHLLSENEYHSTLNAIVMEKLTVAKLYDNSEDYDKYTGDETILSEYNIQWNEDKIKQLPAHLSKEKIDDIIRIAEIIEFLHSKGVWYGDLKQENLGFSGTGVLKIFDFGEARDVNTKYREKRGHYNMDPRQNDVMALGKMFINILTGRLVFQVGRHYKAERFPLNQEQFNAVIEKLDLDSNVLREDLKKMLHISTEGYDEQFLPHLIQDLKSIRVANVKKISLSAVILESPRNISLNSYRSDMWIEMFNPVSVRATSNFLVGPALPWGVRSIHRHIAQLE